MIVKKNQQKNVFDSIASVHKMIWNWNQFRIKLNCLSVKPMCINLNKNK